MNNPAINSLKTLDEFLTNREVTKNITYISEIPKVCREFPCVLGIDEAGRGPVLGPMVYGISFCPVNRADLLVTLECADSKVLTEEKREEIFGKICESKKAIGWAVEVISPTFISNMMLSRTKVSLNEVSMNSAISLVRKAIEDGVNIAHIYVDTVGPPAKYESYLKSLFPKYEITVAKKADSLYPIVSAASICAKVTRDHAIKTWKFGEKLEMPEGGFGSGYPSDPATKKYLEENCEPVFGYPQLVRFSWSTATNALQEHAYHAEVEEELAENSAPANNSFITSFFKSATKGKTKDQHDFFKSRCLESAVDLL